MELKKILEKYDIEALFLKNIQSLKRKLVIKELTTTLVRKITKVYLSDDSISNEDSSFINNYLGYILTPFDLLIFFELYDEDNNKIENLSEY